MTTLAISVLADSHGWGHMAGWGWGGMILGWLFWMALVGFAVWIAIRFFSTSSREPSPDEVLEERFARGELSPEEFQERRALLRR